MKLLNVLIAILLFILSLLFSSCDDELSIKTDYDYSIEMLPIPRKLGKGESVLLEFSIIREEYYSETAFKFRYFQMEGKGTLYDSRRQRLSMNTLYKIDKDDFVLVYQSDSDETQQLDFVFFDNFGKKVDYSIKFGTFNEKEEEE